MVRHRDLVAKIKIAKFFPGVFVGDLKFMLAKISRYTVVLLHIVMNFVHSPESEITNCLLFYSHIYKKIRT